MSDELELGIKLEAFGLLYICILEIGISCSYVYMSRHAAMLKVTIAFAIGTKQGHPECLFLQFARPGSILM
jgi:hypothetical protein